MKSADANRSRQLAMDIRGGFLRAAKILEDGGTPLSTLWMDLIKHDFSLALRTLQGFLPKEAVLTLETEGTLLDVLTSLNNKPAGDDSSMEGEPDPIRH
jgi:hypothetical protein